MVVVVGDMGRSPRMQYHCLSLANQAGFSVDFVGYSGSECWDDVKNHPSIVRHPIDPVQIPSFMSDGGTLSKVPSSSHSLIFFTKQGV